MLYLTGADAVMLVYDVTNTATFESLEDWLEACRVCLAGAERRPSYALVANKIDQVGDSEGHYHYINYDYYQINDWLGASPRHQVRQTSQVRPG